MPRVPYPDPATLTPLQRRIYDGPLSIGKMLAWIPEDVLKGFVAANGAVLTNDTLDEHLRELAIVRVGILSNAPYEVHQHVQYARKIGVPEAKLAGLQEGPGAAAFSEKERALLQFTDELVVNVRPGDGALAALREHFSIPEIATIVVSVGIYMTVSRLLEVTGVELDPDGVVVDPHPSAARRLAQA